MATQPSVFLWRAQVVIRPIYMVVLANAVEGSFDAKRVHCN